MVGVVGRIQTRNYENNEGRTVYVTEVVVESFQMLEPKSVTDSRRSQSDQTGGNYQGQNQSFNTQNSNAFNQNQGQNNNSFGQGDNPFDQNDSQDEDPFEADDDSIHISDDDLPF